MKPQSAFDKHLDKWLRNGRWAAARPRERAEPEPAPGIPRFRSEAELMLAAAAFYAQQNLRRHA